MDLSPPKNQMILLSLIVRTQAGNFGGRKFRDFVAIQFAASLSTVCIECRLQFLPSGNGGTIDTSTRTSTTVHTVYDKCMI